MLTLCLFSAKERTVFVTSRQFSWRCVKRLYTRQEDYRQFAHTKEVLRFLCHRPNRCRQGWSSSWMGLSGFYDACFKWQISDGESIVFLIWRKKKSAMNQSLKSNYKEGFEIGISCWGYGSKVGFQVTDWISSHNNWFKQGWLFQIGFTRQG